MAKSNFYIYTDYTVAFMGDIDIFLVMDRSTNQQVRQESGEIYLSEIRAEAVELCKKLNIDRKIENILLVDE